MRNITASIISKARGRLSFLHNRQSAPQVRPAPPAGSAPALPTVRVDRPADYLISDRIQLFAGWTAGLEDQPISALFQGREIPLVRFPYPSLDDPGLTGFGTYVLAQDLLAGTPDPHLHVEILASRKSVARVPLRLSPLARDLARDFPINTKRYLVPSQLVDNEPPVVVFPGLASVGGCSLNLLMRLEMVRRGWGFPMYWEANDGDLWMRLCDRRQPAVR